MTYIKMRGTLKEFGKSSEVLWTDGELSGDPLGIGGLLLASAHRAGQWLGGYVDGGSDRHLTNPWSILALAQFVFESDLEVEDNIPRWDVTTWQPDVVY